MAATHNGARRTQVLIKLWLQYEKSGHLLLATSDRTQIRLGLGDRIVEQNVWIEVPDDDQP